MVDRWYLPLIDRLAAQPPGTTTVTVTLPEIERLAGGPLPRSAYTGYYWRGSGGKGPRQYLAGIGWRVDGFDRNRGGAVTFARWDARRASGAERALGASRQ